VPTTKNPSAQSITQYNVLVGAANNLITSVAPGVAATVLTSNGVAADPSFQAPTGGSGSWVLIQTQTVGAPVAQVDFTTGISATYATYVLILTNVNRSTNSTFLRLRTSSNGGVSYNSTGYNSLATHNSFGSSNFGTPKTSTVDFVLTRDTFAARNGMYGYIYMYGFASGASPSVTGNLCVGGTGNNTTPAQSISSGFSTNINVDAIRVFLSTSANAVQNIASGTMSLYGILP